MVNFNNGQDLETLVKNADMHLRLKNYADAQSIYEKISKEYPHDYRGWWGMIIIKTTNLTDTDLFAKRDKYYDCVRLSDTYSSITSMWDKVQIVAPKKIKDELAVKFQPFYDLSYAKYEKQLHEASIPNNEKDIERCKKTISNSNEQIQSTEDKIKYAKKCISSCTFSVVGHTFLDIVLGALSVFFIEKAFTLLFSAQIFFGICLAGLAVPCVIYFFKQRAEVKDGYEGIKDRKRDIAEYSSEIRKMNEEIKKINDEIIKIQEKIETAKVNLKKTNEKIAEFEKKMSK